MLDNVTNNIELHNLNTTRQVLVLVLVLKPNSFPKLIYRLNHSQLNPHFAEAFSDLKKYELSFGFKCGSEYVSPPPA